MSSKSTGEFIKELRKERNLSQQQLADLTNIDRTNISKYENNEREPSYFNLEALGKYFKISVTELLAGERKVKDYEQVDASIKKIFKNMMKFKNLSKAILFGSALLISSLIIYITILNYTSTKVYKVYVDSTDIRITDGLLVKTKDKMYLMLSTDVLIDNIDKISIYHIDGNKKEYLSKTTYLESLYIVNSEVAKEYINGKSFNKLLDNTYIELLSNGEVIKVEKLNFEFDYSNKTLDKDQNDFISTDVKNRNINKSEIFDIADNFINNNLNKVFNIKYNGVDYKIEVFENSIHVNYTQNSKEYIILYKNCESNEFITKQRYKKITEIIYSYDVSEKICESSNCESYKDDIKLIKILIEKLKK